MAFLLAAPVVPLQAQETVDFATATAAFERADYTRALALFEEIRQRGTETPALLYNIGVCRFRLREYAAAVDEFADLAERFPTLKALADYNRGLALLALGKRSDAARAFETARNQGDEKLAALALEALAQAREPANEAAPWIAFFDTTLGHDDNVALVDQGAFPSSVSASSSLVEVVGYASRRGERTRLSLSAYAVQYPDAPSFDQQALRLDAAFLWSLGVWQLEAGPHVGDSVLDGDGIERAVGADVSLRRRFGGALGVEVAAQYDDLAAPADRFAYLDGTRERIRVGMDWRTGRGSVRLSYDAERNDRTSTNFAQSRGRVRGSYERAFAQQWSMRIALSRRNSHYNESAELRNEQLDEVDFAVSRVVARSWIIDIGYRSLDNSANVAAVEYRSHRVAVGIGKSF